MKKWQKIVGMIVFGAIGILFGCTRSINYSDGEKVKYSDLPKEVQDTLTWWGKHAISSDTTDSVELPDVICFKSDYSFLCSTFGPWIISRKIKCNTDGKEWRFSGNINIPRPTALSFKVEVMMYCSLPDSLRIGYFLLLNVRELYFY